MKRFMMALVGAVLAIACTQVSAKANTVALGDIDPGVTKAGVGGQSTFNTPVAVDDNVTFTLTTAGTISGNIQNTFVTATTPGGFTFTVLDITGLAASFLSSPLTVDASGNFSYAGILAAGDYLIHVTGTTAGVLGGGYAIQVTAAAAPIPGALLLFVTAIGGMGFAGLRRRGLTGKGSAA